MRRFSLRLGAVLLGVWGGLGFFPIAYCWAEGAVGTSGAAQMPGSGGLSNSTPGPKTFDDIMASLKGEQGASGVPLSHEELDVLFTGPVDQVFLRLRDPFKAFESSKAAAVQAVITELEKAPSSSYRLIGITSGPKQKRALIAGPDGKVHSIVEGVKIGTLGGKVKLIADDHLEIVEKVINPIGEEELNEIQLGFSEVKN